MTWRMRWRSGALCILRVGALCAMLAGCASPTGTTRDLADARVRWASAAISSYQVTVRRSCECAPDATRSVIVTVHEGAIESRRYADTGALVSPAFSSVFPSVEDMFSITSRAIDSHVYQLDARYDPTLGFPSYVYIDVNAQTVDDETLYLLSDFRSL